MRVEAEGIDGLKVVHDYGHGGGGCAQEAFRMVDGSLAVKR